MPVNRTTAWTDDRIDGPTARDEAHVRRGFWRKARRVAGSLPFAEDLFAAYFCAFDRETPLQVKAGLIGALAYFILPADVVPDILPVIGFADDAAILAAAIKLVAGAIRPSHREAARQVLAHGFDDAA